MAKQPTSKNATARVRFIMLEAEIQEGDLSQITAAIQNALKPTTTIIQQRLSGSSATLASGVITDGGEDDVIDLEAEVEGAQPPSTPTRERKPPRRPTVPKVLELDLNSGVSFESFANEHSPKNDVERNLVVLAWYKEHRPDEAVTANHVYTCYRSMKWPSGIDDFSWPLRSLKKDQLVTNPGRGQYAINHIGLARVEKMGGGA